MNLSIVDWFGFDLSIQERTRLIKDAGFNGILLLWADYFDKDYKKIPELARKAGLYVENVHAPYMNANALWEDTINGQDACKEIISCIEDCTTHGITTLVMHPENKKGTETVELPSDFKIGIERIKRIVDTAERLNVNIAIENMSRHEYLDCIFQNIHSERLGLCFDSGHCNIFTPEHDLLMQYGDRLMALHLHDNDGADDWHSLPFSGNVCWDDIAIKLKTFSYSGAIALEVGNKKFEHISKPDEFLRLAIDSAVRMRGLCNSECQH